VRFSVDKFGREHQQPTPFFQSPLCYFLWDAKTLKDHGIGPFESNCHCHHGTKHFRWVGVPSVGSPDVHWLGDALCCSISQDVMPPSEASLFPSPWTQNGSPQGILGGTGVTMMAVVSAGAPTGFNINFTREQRHHFPL
jgi:hypothetical protein